MAQATAPDTTPQTFDATRDVAEEIATEQIRTVHRTIELLKVTRSMITAGMAASSGETEVAMSNVSKAIMVLTEKRDRELDERLSWQRRDWLATQLGLGQGNRLQRRGDRY